MFGEFRLSEQVAEGDLLSICVYSLPNKYAVSGGQPNSFRA
jgi:hypothetical protein